MDTHRLSETQLGDYRNQGFLFLGSVMPEATIDAFHTEEARFRLHPMRNDQDLPGQLNIFRSQVGRYSEVVRRFATEGPHLPLIQQLLGPNLCLWYIQFVTKLPEPNQERGEFPWHQDNGYANIDPGNNVTVWVALDDVNEENGCVWVMPGSHLQGLLPHQKKSEANWYLDVPVSGDGVPAILKAGEAVAFTGLTLHRSKMNRSQFPRRGFFLEYATPDVLVQGTPILDRADAWMVTGQVAIPS